MLKVSKIYLDSVSTTKINDEVLAAYKKLLEDYYNPDSLYDEGVKINDLQERSRENIAKALRVKSKEIIFTSGASEANNLALKGLAFANPLKKHIISSYYEHSSVYNALEQLRRVFGYEITYLYPDHKGIVLKEAILKALRADTLLVSIMHVNNEIGAINDISAIGKALKADHRVYFHADCTQSLGKLPLDLEYVDLASFSAHKIHGIKGSGFLYKRDGVNIEPLISGGQQEFSLRGGTSNAPANIVLAKTVRLALDFQKENYDQISALHDHCLKELEKIPKVRINSFKDGIKTIINFSTPILSEVMVNALNLKGIMVSSKSTCTSKSKSHSRSLEALNINDDYAIRISFDHDNTFEEIDRFIEALKEIIDKYEYRQI